MENLFVIDADDFDVDDRNLDIFFENATIRQFLNDEENSCVSSAKGFGKTFLLKIKRKHLQNKDGIVCIPENRMLDTIIGIAFSNKLLKIVSDYKNWVTLWELSISLSIIKSEGRRNKDFNTTISKEIKGVYEDILKRELNQSPCEILSHILSLDNKEIGLLIQNSARVVVALNLICHKYAIFIDSIDERVKECLFDDENSRAAHGSTVPNIWYFAQYSILEAIIRLGKLNKHINLYCSIRQEAIQNNSIYPTDLQGQISALIKEIRYTYGDLKEMFDIYVKNSDDSLLARPEYKNRNSNMAFCGYTGIENLYIGKSEECFHYIYRHTLQRPRDIMHICKAISEDRANTRDINTFKTVVNESAKKLVHEYLKSIDYFIEDFNYVNIESLFNLFNSNIFRRKELKNICSSYNQDSCEKEQCLSCNAIHLFCQLYNIGLLGYVKEDINNVRKIQSFLPPGCNVYNKNNTLPLSDLYFLHSATNDLIKEIREKKGQEYNICKSLIIGDSKLIADGEINNAVDEIKRGKTIFLSSTHYGNTDIRNVVKEHLKSMKIENVLAYETPDFSTESALLHSHDVCINAVDKCDTFLLIINERYGGTYSGNQYKEELKKHYDRDVSIVWAEYWKAREEKKNIFIFIKERVDIEMSLYKFNKNGGVTDMIMRPEYDDKDGLLDFIDSIQHQRDGNWKHIYRDANHLKDILSQIFN